MVLVDGDRHLHKQLHSVRYLRIVLLIMGRMLQIVQHGEQNVLVMELSA